MFNLGSETANMKAFKTRARASFRERTDKAKNVYFQRVRNMTHDKFLAQLTIDFPGDNKIQIRNRMRTFAGTLAERITDVLSGFSPQTKKVVDEAFEKFEADLALKAGLITTARGEIIGQIDTEAEAFIPEVTTNKFLDTHSFQWVDCIVRGINEFWICRHFDCLLVCPAICWLKNGDGGWQFRCPACLRLYQPWVQSSARVNAQKLLCITGQEGLIPDLDSDESSGEVTIPPCAVREVSLMLQGRISECFLTEWPCTSSANLMNTLRAATLGIIDKAKEMCRSMTLEESEEKLMSYLNVQMVPNNFSVRKFTAAQQLWIKEKNAGARGVDAGWSFEHLKTKNRGDPAEDYNYVGMNYKYTEGEPVLTHEQTVMIFALSKYVCSARLHLANSKL